MISIKGSAEKNWDRDCKFGEGSALDLPFEMTLETGGPCFPADPAKFLPKGMPEWATAPKQHFGLVHYMEADMEFRQKEHIGLGVQLPDSVFDDIWNSLKAPELEMKSIRANLFGSSLTADYGHVGISWEWAPGESDYLLIADFGIRFGPKAVVRANTEG
jgi:hypothetical protein